MVERSTTGSRLFGIGACVCALLAASCDARWDAHAIVRPLSGKWGSADLRIQGSRPFGTDSGDSCEGTIALIDKGRAVALEIAIDHRRGAVLSTTPPGLVPAGTSLDNALLLGMNPAISSHEALEILQMVNGACSGPKIGFPPVSELFVVVAEQRYK